MNILIMGSCRLGEWSSRRFTHTSTKTSTGITQPSVHSSIMYPITLYVNPTGYSVSLPEHLDLLKVFKGDIEPISKEEFPSAYTEIHKFSKNPLITKVPYESIILEVCSLNVIYSDLDFRTQFKWRGLTIPYKIMSPSIIESYNAQSKKMTKLDIESYLQEFVECSGIHPSKIHILGPYLYKNAHGNERGLPEAIYNHRNSFHKDLLESCEHIGVNYHNFSDVLQLNDNGCSSLKDRFHLSSVGVERLSTYAEQHIFDIDVFDKS